jgi:CDP-glycerol glycerophosphotransferase (TagB/SpsB family)/glycosyltransferase involved in cell wall biosynthesis
MGVLYLERVCDKGYARSESSSYHTTITQLDRTPLVSIIVPVYNVEEYLPRCLDSLVNQTLKDIEIIIVNDGSTDNSQAVIDRYDRVYPHLIKPFLKENSGAADTRNFGISRATGDYIGFVDSDDYVAPDMFQKLYKKAVETDSDAVVCRYYRISERLGSRIPNIIDKSAFGCSVVEKPVIILDSRPYLCNKIFKRSLIIDNGFHIPSLRLCEDAAVVYPLLLAANKVEFVDQPLYYYQVDRAESSVNTYDNRFFDIFKAFDIIRDFYQKHGGLQVCFDALAEQCRIIIFIRLRALRYFKDRKFVNLFIRTAYKYLNTRFKGWRSNPYYKNKPEYKKYHGMMRLFFSNRLFLKFYLFILSAIKGGSKDGGMKQGLIPCIKNTRIGGLLFWLLGRSNRQARKFAKFYENKELLENHIFYASFRGEEFSGNPYAIFRYLYNHPDMRDFRHVILTDNKQNPRVIPYLNDKRVIIVSPSDYKNYAKYAETSRYLVVDSSLSPYYIKKKEQVYIHTWHSTLLKTLGSDTDYIWETHNLGKSLLDSDYFVSPNRFTSERLFKAYYCDALYKGKILELGYPRNDLLVHANKEDVRKLLNIPDGKKLVLYAPTWRGTVTKPVKNSDILIKHYESIKSGLGDEYAVLIKLHHMSEKYLMRNQKEYVAPLDIETNVLLAAVDILITDYSGILFDYLITRNPLILFPFDKDEYLLHRGGNKDFYLDLNDIPAVICHTSDEIVDTIRNIDKIAGKKQAYYEEFAKRFVGNDDGRASERVCDIVFRGKDAISACDFSDKQKQDLLIIVDDLDDLRITSRLLSFLDNVDYDKFNVSVWLNSIHSNRTVQRKFNRNVKMFYKSMRFMCLNFREFKSVRRLLKNGLTTDAEKLGGFFRRNMNRNFAGISFDISVYYTGKSELYSMLCLQGIDADKKVAYWHGEKPLSTFKFYDEIVSTNNKELPLDGIAGKTVSRDAFESNFARKP